MVCVLEKMVSAGERIGGFEVAAVLSPRSLLAADPAGRKVVLKPLHPECLGQEGLRDSVRDRLSRVRELPLRGVAEFYGVVGCGDQTYAVWEHVQGRSLAEHLADSCSSLPSGLADELTRLVRQLHDLGLVHGALSAGNVILGRDGVRLTHLNPDWQDDPARDTAALAEILPRIRAAGDGQPECSVRVRQIGDGEDALIRRRAIRWAGACAAAGVLLCAAVMALNRSVQPPLPSPPEADPALLRLDPPSSAGGRS